MREDVADGQRGDRSCKSTEDCSRIYDKKYSNTTLNRKTDFVALAESFGAKGYRANDIESFKKAFADAYSQEGPTLIDLTIDKDLKVLPMMRPGGTFDKLIIGEEDEA